MPIQSTAQSATLESEARQAGDQGNDTYESRLR